LIKKLKRIWKRIEVLNRFSFTKSLDEYLEGDPVNRMFQMLYQNADENTRRAMMKSYQTSGGTVL